MRARIVLRIRSEGTETARTDFILSAWLGYAISNRHKRAGFDIHPDSVRKVKTMKDSINYFIPIMQDPMNDITGRCLTHHVSSNAYYGYQPVVGKEGEARIQQEQRQIFAERMDTCDDGNIQFNNLIEVDVEEEDLKRDKEVRVNRKRTWVYDEDLPDYKKRRENADDPFPLIPEPPPSELHPNDVKVLAHRLKIVRREEKALVENKDSLLEELLRETHGICSYHWQGHDT